MRSMKWLGIAGALMLGGLLWARADLCCSPAWAEPTPVKPSKGAKSVALHVEGMTCASCKVTVRMALKKLDGVKNATVNVEEKSALVEYDPAKVTPAQMVEAVNKSGYRASLPDPKRS